MTNTPLKVTLAAALVVCATIAVPHAKDRLERPAVPGNLEVDLAYEPFLLAHAGGTQNYVCLPSGNSVAWAFHGPQATLFDGALDQTMTHYLSPNPQEAGSARATWRHSRDSSTVWAVAVETSIDAAYVAPGAIPWLKLQVVGKQYGPDGGSKLTTTAFIQRVNTAGGVAPATGCAVTTDIGRRALVPYTTDYVFYR